MNGLHRLYPIKGVVQPYSWGGFEFIPDLLGIENAERKPFAEYWLGSHPASPATIISPEGEERLDDFLKRQEIQPLPFLLKILDVRQMLSIQVHPDKASAQKGFEDEERRGVTITASNRNYKDTNHKPELMVALSDFWLLHGFKDAASLRDTIEKIEAFSFLKHVFNNGDYKTLYEKVMSMPQQDVDAVLQPLVEKIVPQYRSGQLQKDDPNFWAARAVETFCSNGQLDRGIFSIYFFNLLHLKKGQGIYQPSGLPHAYLEGQNVEIMANSDNVLRAGLTDKHIDIEELMKHVKFEATYPDIIDAKDRNQIFAPPVDEFELHRYALEDSLDIHSKTLEIWIVVEGMVKVEDLTLKKGEACFVTPGHHFQLQIEKPATLFRAVIPTGGKN